MRLILLISTLIILFPLTRGDQKQRTLSCKWAYGKHMDVLDKVIGKACQWGFDQYIQALAQGLYDNKRSLDHWDSQKVTCKQQGPDGYYEIGATWQDTDKPIKKVACQFWTKDFSLICPDIPNNYCHVYP